MLWNNNSRLDLPTRGEIARQSHSAWLTWALASEERFPKIPSQAVRDGGYEDLLATRRGRAACQRWWRRALAAVERLTPSSLREW